MALHSFTLRRDTGPAPDVVESFLNSFEVYLNANNPLNTEQLAYNAGTLGVDANGQLGATAGAEASDPLLLSLTGSPYIYFGGSNTNAVTIPDSASTDVTGDVVLRVAYAPVAATGSASEIFMKGTSWTSGLNYGIGIDTSGNAVLKVIDSGATLRTFTSSTPAWTTNGQLRLVEASLNVTTAVATFRVKELTDITAVAAECADDTGWEALGTTVSGTITGAALAPNSTVLQARYGTVAGALYYADVRAGGVVRASINPAAAASASATSWTTAQGQTATVARASSGIKTALVIDSAVWLFDGSDYIDVPDVAALDLGAGEELTMIAVVREHATQGTSSRIMGKASPATNSDGYFLSKSFWGTLAGSIRDGAVTNNASVTGFTASSLHVLGLTVGTMVVSPGVIGQGVRTWLDGLPEMTGGDPPVPVPATARTATDCSNALTLRIGADSTGANFFTGEVVAVGVTKRALAAEEMAAISSYFRNTSFAGGYGDWLRPLEDSAPLRSDNYSNVPKSSGSTYFDVAPISYTEVQIDWNIVMANVTNIQVVASLEGHPVTILDGRLVTSLSALNALGSVVDTSATPGRWHYYSLFAKIDDGSTPHYERVATANCLVPYDFQSTDMLYRRIPPWYQEQDAEGDLLRFINLIGYEMDFARTMSNVLRDIRDPATIPASALYEAGRMLGIPRVVEGISETRYRALLRNFAYLNSTKGTLEGIKQYLSVITGCKVEVEVLGPNNIGVSLYAQRVNLVREPIMNGTLWTETTFSGTASASYSGGVCTISGGGSGGQELITMNNIPFDINSTYGFGATITSATAGSDFKVLLLDPTGTTGAVIGQWYTLPGGNFRAVTPPTALPSWSGSAWEGATTLQLQLQATVPAGGTLRFKEPILEPGAAGDYFDGSSIAGGFLPGSTGVQDYRWLGSDNGSESAYTMNYGVVQGVVEAILPYICPAGMKVGTDMVKQYHVTDFNVYPGS